jgi:hypothetical protein
MSRTLPRVTVFSLAAAVLVAATAFAQDKDQGKKKAGRPDRDTPTVVSPDDQRVSGVIVKAESIGKGAKSRPEKVENEKGRTPTHRLTINTAAVWRDWVRDQAGTDPGATPREAAKRGAGSVATKGEPQSLDTLVVIDVVPKTKIETRFRESTDETSKGGQTPAEARAAIEAPASEKGKADSKTRRETQAEQPPITRFQADDLQAGLFVEVDFRRQDARDVASTVTVIRPLGGSDTPDKALGDEGKAKPKAKAKSKNEK